ncbi:MAG TPA: hypothetical protein VGL75_00950 [Acidothermaceae bacterium]|jgi:hypothetical protein
MTIDGTHAVGDPGHTSDHNTIDDFLLGLLGSVEAPVTSAGTLVVGQHNPLDCTSGSLSFALPVGTPGALLSVDRVDGATAHTCTITGSIRGVGSSSLTLLAPSATPTHESVMFLADTSGSWWPVAGHKSKSWLDAEYLSRAADYGYAAMTCPPDTLAVSSAAMSNAGTITGSVMQLAATASPTSLDFSVATAGSGLTSGHCGVAVFDSTKTLIGTAFTADGATDLATALTGTGKHTCTLTPTGTGLTSLATGKLYAVMFQNGTTAAILKAPANTSAVNGNLSAANSKYFTADTGRTTSFPTTLGTFTARSGADWFAIF